MDRLRLERLSAGLLEWAVMLLPLLVYVLYLALVVNRQRRPVVVSGMVDQALLLVALSGFLLVGPLTWPLHRLRPMGETFYWAGYAAYVLVVLGIALGAIRRRRNAYVVYNVHPQKFVEVLRAVLKELGIHYAATPGRIAWDDGRSVLDVSASHLGSSVILTWKCEDDAVRAAVEPRLTASLRQVATEGNLATLPLLLLSLVLTSFIVFALAIQAFLTV